MVDYKLAFSKRLAIVGQSFQNKDLYNFKCWTFDILFFLFYVDYCIMVLIFNVRKIL